MGFIQHNSESDINNVPFGKSGGIGLPVPLELVHRRLLLDELVPSLETALLSSERSFQCPVRNENLYKEYK